MRVFLTGMSFMIGMILIASTPAAFGQTCAQDTDRSVVEITYWNYSGVDPGVSVTLCDSTSVPVTVAGSGSGPYIYTAPTGKYVISITIGSLTFSSTTGSSIYTYGGNTYGAVWSMTGPSNMTVTLTP